MIIIPWKDTISSVRNARILLFVIAALQLVPIFLIPPMGDLEKYITIGIYVLFAGIFAALALWTKKKTLYRDNYSPQCVYRDHFISCLFPTFQHFQGWLLHKKAVVYVMLIVGLKNAKDVQEWLDSKNKKIVV